MKTLTLTQFSQMLVETKQSHYEVEKDYVFNKVRSRFNELINRSAKYVEGRKVIDFDKVQHLKLAFRKQGKYVSYAVAFARFVEKCRQDKYASKWGLNTLTYVHNTYI